MIEQNHECYVSLEVAKLLKEAGFNWEVNHSYPDVSDLDNLCSGYMEDLPFYHNLNDGKYGGLSVPTLEVAQRWLRERKKVFLHTNGIGPYTTFLDSFAAGEVHFTDYLDTYEEALEAGIKKALEIMLKKR